VIDNSDEWLKRAKEVLVTSHQGLGTGYQNTQFAASMLTALYGPGSAQVKQFQDSFAAVQKQAQNGGGLDSHLHHLARGVIRNTIAELEAGLIVNLRATIAGEVLVELIRLAKDALIDQTEAAKNIAAVLVAAAYESLIRRMGEEFAGVAGRPKLEEVIGSLKTASVLKGGQIATAQSYLKFRNDSLHADWRNVDRSQVESCLAFSESLLLKHFS
jgi:hypothetical protein